MSFSGIILSVFIRNRKWWREVAVFGLFVVLSTIMWYFFSLHQTRDTTLRVPVKITTKSGNVLFPNAPEFIDVNVSDVGSRLLKLKKQKPMLEIFTDSKIKDKEGVVVISAADISKHLSGVFSESVKINGFNPQEFRCEYVRQKKKTVPIILQAHFIPRKPNYWFPDKPKLEHKHVEVIGPPKVLDTIRNIHTVSDSVFLTSDTMEVSVGLQKPDNVTLSFESVNVRVCTEAFTETSFTLPVNVLDVPAKYEMKVFPSSAKVIIRVSERHFKDIRKDDYFLYCRYPKDANLSVLSLQLRRKSDNMEAHVRTRTRLVPRYVEYVIIKK